jgi:hypothetical protein
MWPVLIAPLVAFVYYWALRNALASAIGGLVHDAGDVDFEDLTAPTWGSHWIYRIFAETAALALGTLVAAGIARERARAAAIVGACAISLGYLLRNAAWAYVIVFGSNGSESIEPWYQHLIEVLVVLGAPFIGAAMSTVALEVNGRHTTGLAGINRLHFLWLWAAASIYVFRMVTPLSNFYSSQFTDYMEGNRISAIIHTIIYGLPVAAYAIPLILGLSVLAGKGGWRRNIFGPVIIVFGWLVATSIHFFWEKFVGGLLG